jgi:septal ring factor EnvC (AmiA/AmiB activator)
MTRAHHPDGGCAPDEHRAYRALTTSILGETVRTTRSITLAMATTAAIGAFAVLPVSAALASDDDDDTATTTSTTAPADDRDEAETGDDATSIARLHDVRIRAVDDDIVHVSWALEHGGTAATGYSVQLRTGPKGRSTSVVTATEAAGVLQHDFSSLDPDSLYSAVVTATYPDGTTSVRQSNAARTDRTVERTAADEAVDTAEHAQHDAKQAAKAAAKAAKKAAHAAAKAQHRSDHATKKAAKHASALAKKATKAAARLKHEAEKATKRAARADHRADDADDAASESEIEND